MNDKFFWGLATSSAQIEGGYLEDGRTESIWDLCTSEIKDYSNCHVACDFYHHYQEDIKLFKSLGINSFRLSISWSRIIPSKGIINQKGIEFYNKVIDELLYNGITPFITLYHWDLPEWVNKLGGWESEEIILLFEEYAKVCAKSFSDRVKYWFVFNEPQIFLTEGYFKGVKPPFVRTNKIREVSLIAMKAHKKAVDAIRKHSKQEAKIGLAVANSIYIPSDNSESALIRAKSKTFDSYEGKLWNCWYSDPLIGNKEITLDENNYIDRNDLISVYSKLDFIGINYYLPAVDNEYKPLREHKTQMDWYVDERGIYWVCKYYHERYNLPIIISENGFAEIDVVNNGEINDDSRCEYLEKYLNFLFKAKREGIDIFGYLYWSALDNFEWCEGYRPRFGLIYVDYKTQKRIVKKSGFKYKSIIEKETN